MAQNGLVAHMWEISDCSHSMSDESSSDTSLLPPTSSTAGLGFSGHFGFVGKSFTHMFCALNLLHPVFHALMASWWSPNILFHSASKASFAAFFAFHPASLYSFSAALAICLSFCTCNRHVNSASVRCLPNPSMKVWYNHSFFCSPLHAESHLTSSGVHSGQQSEHRRSPLLPSEHEWSPVSNAGFWWVWHFMLQSFTRLIGIGWWILQVWPIGLG
jgi:hypothetical protein